MDCNKKEEKEENDNDQIRISKELKSKEGRKGEKVSMQKEEKSNEYGKEMTKNGQEDYSLVDTDTEMDNPWKDEAKKL